MHQKPLLSGSMTDRITRLPSSVGEILNLIIDLDLQPRNILASDVYQILENIREDTESQSIDLDLLYKRNHSRPKDVYPSNYRDLFGETQ